MLNDGNSGGKTPCQSCKATTCEGCAAANPNALANTSFMDKPIFMDYPNGLIPAKHIPSSPGMEAMERHRALEEQYRVLRQMTDVNDEIQAKVAGSMARAADAAPILCPDCGAAMGRVAGNALCFRCDMFASEMAGDPSVLRKPVEASRKVIHRTTVRALMPVSSAPVTKHLCEDDHCPLCGGGLAFSLLGECECWSGIGEPNGPCKACERGGLFCKACDLFEDEIVAELDRRALKKPAERVCMFCCGSLNGRFSHLCQSCDDRLTQVVADAKRKPSPFHRQPPSTAVMGTCEPFCGWVRPK